ncbi:MAG: hypothetical protein ACI86M_002320 [Saprospiraceae bacterium]|jgi:hypothetical protein
MLKQRAALESFSCRTANGIEQDFQAKIFMMVLSAALTFPIAEKIKTENSVKKKRLKYDQQLNRTSALREIKTNLISIFIKRMKQNVLDAMDKLLLTATLCIRPNRKFYRIKSVKRRKSTNYKPM